MNDDPPLTKEEADARFQEILDKLEELNHKSPSGETIIVIALVGFVFWVLGILGALHLSL